MRVLPLSGQCPFPRGWPLNRGGTVFKFAETPHQCYAIISRTALFLEGLETFDTKQLFNGKRLFNFFFACRDQHLTNHLLFHRTVYVCLANILLGAAEQLTFFVVGYRTGFALQRKVGLEEIRFPHYQT